MHGCILQTITYDFFSQKIAYTLGEHYFQGFCNYVAFEQW